MPKLLQLPPDKTLLLGRKPAANLFALISAQIMEAISPRPVVALTLVRGGSNPRKWRTGEASATSATGA